MRGTRNEWTQLAMAVVLGMLAADEAMAEGVGGGRTAGTSVRASRRIVVSIPDRRLAVLENDAVLRLFDVAVGSPTSPSPTGTFTIVNRIAHPTYYAPGKVVPPSDTNPLGTRWLGLSIKSFGIHGTDVPGSIGHAQSHGCIRLRNRDVERLFDMVRTGDVVELRGERTPDLARIFGTSARPNVTPAAVTAVLRSPVTAR